MTSEDLLTARAARQNAVRPAELTPESVAGWVAELGFATLAQLGDAAAEPLEAALAERRVVELWLWPGVLRYCSAELLGYAYVCVGDRYPQEDYKRQVKEKQLSWLAAEVYEQLLAAPAARTPDELRAPLGVERTSPLGIERALGELARTMKVVRLGRRDGAPQWQTLLGAFPHLRRAVDTVSLVEAAAALISGYLDAMVCEDEESLAAFFAPLFSRSRVRAALTALEAAQEAEPMSLDGRAAWRLREGAQAQP
jgi:hypothetical protein